MTTPWNQFIDKFVEANLVILTNFCFFKNATNFVMASITKSPKCILLGLQFYYNNITKSFNSSFNSSLNQNDIMLVLLFPDSTFYP